MTIAIVDIETTGFLQKGGYIVEIGIAELDLKTGEIKKVFDSVCHETGITRFDCSSSWIVKNSDLSVEDIRNSPNLKKIRKEVQTVLNRYWQGVTAFNNKFDFDFLEDRGFTFPKKLACPMKALTDVIKLPGRYGKNKWPSAEEAYHYYFPEERYHEAHRGYDDAYHEAKIVYEAYIRGDFKL